MRESDQSIFCLLEGRRVDFIPDGPAPNIPFHSSDELSCASDMTRVPFSFGDESVTITAVGRSPWTALKALSVENWH